MIVRGGAWSKERREGEQFPDVLHRKLRKCENIRPNIKRLLQSKKTLVTLINFLEVSHFINDVPDSVIKLVVTKCFLDDIVTF